MRQTGSETTNRREGARMRAVIPNHHIVRVALQPPVRRIDIDPRQEQIEDDEVRAFQRSLDGARDFANGGSM